jgi:Zn-dependent membrane protease YugP
MLLFIAIFVFTLALSGWASLRVRRAYAMYSKVPSAAGLTGAQTAAAILRAENIRGVEIVEHPDTLGDHYDPKHRRLVLSSENYHGTSAAAVGVAAHECGHAIQHQAGYAPLHVRMAAVSVTNVASQIVMWLPLIGIGTGLLQPYTGMMIIAIAFGVLMLFQLITLPVEFDATRRAKICLSSLGIIRSEAENEAVNKMLGAAAFTYVAAFITSLVYLLWHLLPFLGFGRHQED